MHHLLLNDVEKHYGDTRAVKGISLDVPAGEFLVLVGPSGCGKSTLLRAIAGLEEISGGDIQVDGNSIARLAPRERNVAMVFQSYALYPYLNVYENVAFGLHARRLPETKVREQVHWAADLLDIGDYLERFPRELSGGQRQRVAIGRAIVRDATLFLFDEPLSNLDAKLRDGMREELKRLHQRLGKTFIYVTHDQIEAMTLADRIVLLNQGVIEQAGTPLELFERPANKFVAGFLGSPSMNFIDVTVGEQGRSLILPDNHTIPTTKLQLALRPHAGKKLMWGVRPEHFVKQGDSPSSLTVRLEIVQPTGSRTYGSFDLGGSHAIAELDAHDATTVGQKLEIAVALERTTFFDPGTGKALRIDGAIHNG